MPTFRRLLREIVSEPGGRGSRRAEHDSGNGSTGFSPLRVRVCRVLFGCLIAGALVAPATAQTRMRLAPGESLSQQLGSTKIQIQHNKPTSEKQALPSATLIVDKDVRVGGNHLSAGKYKVGLQAISDNDVHVVFRTEDEEWLRYAVRPHEHDGLSTQAIEFVFEKPQSNRRGRRRRRRPTFAEIHFHWEDQRVSWTMQMTGVVWRATPEPKMPAQFREPWKIVKSSLMGFVHQSMNEHVEHFAENFESDWDDGGSQEAHMQMVGRMLFEGEFEDTVLKLDKLQWEQDNGRIIFRNAIVQAPLGTVPLAYTVEKSEHGWKIVHLDGPKL